MTGRKITLLKVLGMTAAVFLITFGSLENIWRTIKLWAERLEQK